MRFSHLSALSLLSIASGVLADADTNAESAVIPLTAADFNQTVQSADIILVEFYAPWCGHCKALAPHYDEASIALKEKNIPLAKVDCVDQAELCSAQEVNGYPTLKIFRKGEATPYAGPRQASGIISYMIKQSLPAVTNVQASNFEEFKHADRVVLVAFLDQESDSPVEAFKTTAEDHRDDYLFGMSTDPEVIKAAGVKPPAIMMYRAFDEPEVPFTMPTVPSPEESSQIVFDGPISGATPEDIIKFVHENMVPILDEVGQENYGVYATSGLPLAYFFLHPNDTKREEYLAALRPIAQKHKGKINFVSIDADFFKDHAKALTLDPAKHPAFVIQNLQQQLKYPLSQEADLTMEAVAQWADDFSEGKLLPNLRSEPIPETQGPVYTIVGKTFDEVVFDDKKDVFVEFYAPWCGHCKRLAPTWEALAEHYGGAKDTLLIAKMDATENDVPPSATFRITGFPTLKFKPAGTRDFIDYNGERSLESLIEFIEEKAANPLPGADSPKASAKVEDVPEAHEHDEL